MKKLTDITKQINNIMDKSRGLNDEDFDKLLANIQFTIKNTIQTRKRHKSKMLESTSFIDFVRNKMS